MKANKKRPKPKTAKQNIQTKKRAQPKVDKRNVLRRSSTLTKPSGKKTSAKSRKGATRVYSTATIKELFALCSNQCAFPNCTNEIVAAGTKWSKGAVVGQICHIYAASDRGPRGKPELTEAERNSAANLILMCGHHHPLVDKQWATYPATTLKKWKEAHEAKATKGTAEAIKREAEIEKHVFFVEMSDDQIDKALARIRQARYLVGFPATEEAQTLAIQVEQAKYSSGSGEKRARALAWCARVLSQGSTTTRAKELLRKSTEICATPEAALAQAFITAATDTSAALAALAKIKTPASLSAALRIVTNKDGAKKALTWVTASGLSIDSFDAEGKFTLVMNALVGGEWTTARKAIDSVTESDFAEFPLLLHAASMAHLLTAIPNELRAIAMNQVPFEAEDFPLASTSEYLAERRAAQTLFERIAKFAREVGSIDASNIASDYALWLGLRDPDGHDAALIELRDSMSDPHRSLRRVNLAIRFGLNVDFAALEERIDRSIALSGRATADEALARLSLAFTKESPKAIADYIEKHRMQLYEHLQKESIICFEIEVLARAGLVTTARQRLEEAVHDGLSPREQDLLQRILAEVSGSDPIAERRALYESTGDMRALTNLVDALERAQLWQDMLPFAEKLFAIIPSAKTYYGVVRCLNELGRYDELLASMLKNQGLIDQSQNLKSVWAWTMYREGRFADSDAALQRLSSGNAANTRKLRINIAIASGAWDRLLGFCQETWNDRDKYSATELLHSAQISVAVNGPHSRDLVVTATEKEPDNPAILIAAYFLATTAGWEQSPAVAGWLNRAAQLSGDDGPLKAISMQELVEQKPEWDKQAEGVWDQLKKGKIPTFAAGQVLNRSLLDFYLLPSLANPSQVDVRKRSNVFAYSGARLPLAIAQPTTLALDLAAIITFSRLGLLDKVLSRYQIVVPHSTLGWLFQERQKATFHQPSRIKDAAAIKQLIAIKALIVACPAASRDHKLTRQVGADLAAMLSVARERLTTGSKTLVVRSSPLHRLGTVLGEEADITGYESCICSCAAVIDRLKTKGALTLPEEQKARDFLRLHERSWPNEPAIDDQSEIYLDDLSVSYLQTAGVLGKLKAAGLKASISQREDSDANSLLGMELLGNQQLEYIEQIRSALAAGIASGRVKAVRTMKVAEDDQLLRLHPTYGALGLVVAADAIVVDDRFVNQHPTMTNEARTTPVLCSLDVLNLLHAGGELTAEELFAHRIVLRQCGYQLICLTDDEILYHLRNAPVATGGLVETAELRVIRESLMSARMGAIVQLPGETHFLHRTLGAYIRAMKVTWETVPDRAEARADYLLAQVDIRKWTSSTVPGNERAFALYAYAAHALQITSPPLNADRTLKAAYYEWVSDRFLKPIKEYQPEMYEWIVARSRELVVGGAEQAAREYEGAPMIGHKHVRAAMLMAHIEAVPPIIRDELLSDTELRSDFGLEIDAVLKFGDTNIAFRRSKLFTAVRTAGAAPGRAQKVSDLAGVDWEIVADTANGAGDLIIRSGLRTLRAGRLLLLTKNKNARKAFFAFEAERLNLPSAATKRWKGVLDKRPLLEEEINELMTDASHTPVAVTDMIIEHLSKGNISLNELVPRSLDYYERLVGRIEGQVNIKEYANEVATKHVHQLMSWRSTEGLRHALLMGSHPLIADVIASKSESEAEFDKLAKWAQTSDPIARGVTLELAVKRARDKSKIGANVHLLAERFSGQGDKERYDSFAMLSAAFVMVDGELSMTRVLASKPPFWRRLAAFAQAALITRCILSTQGDLSEVVAWMNSVRIGRYHMQCYVDLRSEPRWLANFAMPQQLKSEIGGRVLAVAARDEEATDELGLRDVLISDAPQSLKKQLNLLLTVLPGPLEGNIDCVNQLDPDILKLMREQLVTPSPSVSSFTLAANTALLYKFPDDIPGLIADAIRRAQYRIDSDGKPEILQSCLSGLATVAAVNRSHQLADELFIVIRSYRRFCRDELDLDAAFQIGMLACASRADLRDWCKCVGALVADLGFGELDRGEAASLYSLVIDLCDIVPELWATCAQGIAATEAVGFS